MSEVTIGPCPVCGGVAKSPFGVYVYCADVDCPMTPMLPESWNHLSSLAAEVARLRAALEGVCDAWERREIASATLRLVPNWGLRDEHAAIDGAVAEARRALEDTHE